MRKLLAIAIMLVFVFSVSSIYACGDKSGAAKASSASTNSSCASKAAKVEKADVSDNNIEVTAANYRAETVDANVHCASKGETSKTSVMKADATSGCPAKANATKVNVMKADAKSCCPAKATAAKTSVLKADAKAADCPASKECPVPCNKETKLENMKAEKMEKAPELSVSPQTVSSEVTND